MDNSYVFNETTLRRLPQFMVLIIILLLGLPYIGMNLGLNFSIFASKINQSDNPLVSYLVQAQIRGYFRQTLLQWSGFSLAAVTALLAFTQYRLTNDRIAFIIALSVLFSGSVEALHTLLVDGLSLEFYEKTNLDALIWVFSNSISGLVLIFGLTLILNTKDEPAMSFKGFILLTTFFVLTAFALIYYSVEVISLPDMWIKNYIVSRPYELISIAIYLILALFFYPKTYKQHPCILSDCIFYMSITQIVLAIYIMVLCHHPYDSAFNIAYFLKVISYFIPCTCLVINYVFSYTAVLNAQKKLRIQQEELKYMASHDALTNLFNRREFEELLDKSIANAAREKSNLGLLLIDLDNFKIINDNYGHGQGDELLKQFSSRLCQLTRKGDLLSRVGGDEFTLIYSNIKSISSLRQLSERILLELNKPYTLCNKLVTVSVSIGISIYPQDGVTTEDLLRKADLAMYKAKTCGKNTYQFYTEHLAFIQHREAEIESHIRIAIEEDEFKLYFQPKYNLLTQEIVGAEILLHWQNKYIGTVSPVEFIPIAERTGLIVPLGQWVLRKSLEQIIHWQDKYKNYDIIFAINISPIQLANREFYNNLEQLLTHHAYPPQLLEFEITESVLMDESNDVANLLTKISSLGIKLSLDDFGKGFSSLNRLKTLPINTLKIDKEFIADIKDKDDKVVLVDIIIKLAEELNMHIVAEGIETSAQLDYLVSRNCQEGQGFLFSKPLAPEDFASIVYMGKNLEGVIKR